MEFDLRGYDALVVMDASQNNADLFYATRFRAPDPVTFVQLPAESLLMVGDLELDRARAQATVDRVVAGSAYQRRLKDAGIQQPRPEDMLLALLQDLNLRRVLVPDAFPLGKADFLRAAGLQVEAAPDPLLPQRQIKTATEIEAVRQAMRAAEHSLEAALDAIRNAEVVHGVLHAGGKPLTSERLRRLIQLDLMQQDFLATQTIVAGGDQGCDPHQTGTGPLRAGETIIIDIFPQSMLTGYFGDITRTVVKGPAPEPVKALYDTVRQAQDAALARIAAGMDGAQIHRELQQFFANAGYETGQVNGHMQGFFHGTGHGVGLEVHETPRLGLRGDTLCAGHIVTVEPGLYYPGLGGVRIEDTVVVSENGYTNLTAFPRLLEI